MPRQQWAQAIGYATQDGTAVANTTTETILFPNFTFGANQLQDGATIRIRAFGKLSVTGTPTIQFALRLGGVAGTLLAQSEAITNGSGLTNVNWSLNAVLQVRTNGATGTVLVMGECSVQTNSSGDPTIKTNIFGVSGSDAPATATVDLTVDQALALTAKWSAASASNTITGMIYIIESIN